jgi:hypothetical protein
LKILAAITVTILAISFGCGSESSNSVASSGDTNDFGFEISITTKPDSIFSIDDVKSTGWKSSKEFPTDELEGVSEVWFGFFQQKNLEVWIYESHDEAKRLGTVPAEEIVAATRGVSGGGAGPYMKQTTHFGAYGVVGNLLILCETDVEVCEDLANALP